MSDVTVTRQPLRGMITLRGDLTDATLGAVVQELTGAAVPHRLGIALDGERGVAWMAPDELMLLLPRDDVPAALARLADALAGQHHLAVDVSDARAVFTIAGAGLRDVLARLTPADVSAGALGPGTIRRTRVAQVAAAFWLRDEARVEVLCFRSVTEYVAGLLANAAETGPPVLH